MRHHQLVSLHANGDNDDDELYGGTQHEKADEESMSNTPTPSITDRIKTGDTLDILAVSVILLFVATAWLSGGRLIDGPSNPGVSTNQAKTRVYKYVDADKLLQEEFDRQSSTVKF